MSFRATEGSEESLDFIKIGGFIKGILRRFVSQNDIVPPFICLG